MRSPWYFSQRPLLLARSRHGSCLIQFQCMSAPPCFASPPTPCPFITTSGHSLNPSPKGTVPGSQILCDFHSSGELAPKGHSFSSCQPDLSPPPKHSATLHKRMTNSPALQQIHLESPASAPCPALGTLMLPKATRLPAAPCRKRDHHSRARSWFVKSENFFFFFFNITPPREQPPLCVHPWGEEGSWQPGVRGLGSPCLRLPGGHSPRTFPMRATTNTMM